MKQIKIGRNEYVINDSPEVAQLILAEIIEWMEHKNHYAAHSGEGIMQSDDCLIDAPELISDIVDKYLKPKHLPADE